ncbi:MAG: phosphomannose isomerase type II C-terminal cupin domain [Minisyncoccia bacterium]|jgi:mannose-6-phosphate isomerase-like protein (cupin superfamily)
MQPPKPFHEERPWGEFTEFTRNKPSTVKLITVRPGEALSLQCHSMRDEFWRVISGEGIAEIGKVRMPAQAGGEFFIPRGTYHRLEGGASPLTVLEIALGAFDDDDIVRLEDRYGRATPPKSAGPGQGN